MCETVKCIFKIFLQDNDFNMKHQKVNKFFFTLTHGANVVLIA